MDSQVQVIVRAAVSFLASSALTGQGMLSMKYTRRSVVKALIAGPVASLFAVPKLSGDQFKGKHFRGRGDVEYLELLDLARRMFVPDPEFQNLSMLYGPAWNGLVEGPTWNAWWIQNSYGPSYCALPFLQEPFLTFLQNSQDLWFSQMGNGRRHGCPGNPRVNWVAPNGQLCDCASPGCIIYKQGDGRVQIHDWGLEFTAAGVVLQAELLLISRDPEAIARYLPKLERSVNFLDTRRDTKNNLFLAGPAANLLAPSYAGWHRPDGTYGKAYLAGLSITYIAALDRLIELEKLAGAIEKVRLYTERRNLARKGLPRLVTEEGYFVKSLDPDGTKHGVFGARQHGYFEATVNHDAIAFRVVDRTQAEKIYAKIAAIPALRPHDFIITNYPSLDDMYEELKGIWRFGEWVNGGAWSTCEARMIMGYYRLGKYEDARRSMEKLLTFARRFRMDNPLTDFGNEVYQPNQVINLTYDAFGPAAAFVRGLFEYLYAAEGLTLVPHIPPGITELVQLDPVRFGQKRLYLSAAGSGSIRAVTVNGQIWRSFNESSVFLPYAATPAVARIVIWLGGRPRGNVPAAGDGEKPQEQIGCKSPMGVTKLMREATILNSLVRRLETHGLGSSYEAAHARLALEAIAAACQRNKLQAEGKLERLSVAQQIAAAQSYLDTSARLFNGLMSVLSSYEKSKNLQRRKMYRIYLASTT